MNRNPTIPAVSRIAAIMQWAFPNAWIACWVVLGAALEVVLLARDADNVFVAGGVTPWLSISLVAWSWLTMGILVLGLTRMIDRLEATGHRVAARSFLAIGTMLFVAAIVAYVVSWALYLRTGRFASLEVLRFTVENPPTTMWLDLQSSERTAVGFLLGGAILLCGLVPWFLIRTGRSEWSDVADRRSEPHRSESRRLSPWMCLTMVVLATSTLLILDRSPQRRSIRFETLKVRLNPVAAFATSVFDTFLCDPIEACLDPAMMESRSLVWKAPARNERNRPSIIFVAIESLRHDVVHQEHQGRPVMPHLNRLARKGQEWTRAYAQSTHSDYADVCIVSSLYPLRTRTHHYYRSTDPWPRTLIYDLLKPAGYRTAIVSSQNESWGGMDQFLETPGLDLFYDAKRSGAETYLSSRDPGMAQEIQAGMFEAGRLDDAHTTSVAIRWIGEQVEAGRPFFLSMNLQSSHFPYELASGVEQPFQPCHLDPDVSFMQYPVEKTPQVRNAYFNAVHHCDQQIGRLVAALEQHGILDDVILVVLGENGEAFHESGSVGHAREPVEPAIHVATVIHAPKYLEPSREDYPIEHVDLVPTLFGMMGWPAHPNFQGRDALAADRPRVEDRMLYFHVLSPAARADAVTLAGRWKYQIDHDRHRATLVDLAHDPDESTDVSAQHPAIAARLHVALETWRQRQLAYYHFPHYYGSYYPPKPLNRKSHAELLEK